MKVVFIVLAVMLGLVASVNIKEQQVDLDLNLGLASRTVALKKTDPTVTVTEMVEVDCLGDFIDVITKTLVPTKSTKATTTVTVTRTMTTTIKC